MAKQAGRRTQLRLPLQYEYLKQLAAASEELACYEATARAFIGDGRCGKESGAGGVEPV